MVGRTFLVIAASLVLISCVTPARPLPPPPACPAGTPIPTSQIQFYGEQLGERPRIDSNVALGTRATVNVGEALIDSTMWLSRYRTTSAAQFDGDHRIDQQINVVIPAYAAVVGVYNDGSREMLLVPTQSVNNTLPFYYAQLDQDGLLQASLVRDNISAAGFGTRGFRVGGVSCVSFGEGKNEYELVPFVPTEPVNATVTEVMELVGEERVGTRFEIVYNGLDGDTIRFQYREYTDDDMARPAFFQDLTYPASSGLIVFRDVEIAVSRVSANSIEYTVVAGPVDG